MRIWKEPKERILLISSILLFVLLCAIKYRFPLVDALDDTWVGDALVGEALEDTISSLIVSILAAYFFYLLIDFMPRVRREDKTRLVLDSLLASILDAFNRCRIFGHETAISHVDKSVLNKSWLLDRKQQLMEKKSTFLPLKFSMQTAHTRLEDFRHALPLAVSLSPESALKWLVIIDKVRLFAESYGEQPVATDEEIRLVDSLDSESELQIYKSDLNLRFLEFVEQVIEWKEITEEKNG